MRYVLSVLLLNLGPAFTHAKPVNYSGFDKLLSATKGDISTTTGLLALGIKDLSRRRRDRSKHTAHPQCQTGVLYQCVQRFTIAGVLQHWPKIKSVQTGLRFFQTENPQYGRQDGLVPTENEIIDRRLKNPESTQP